MDVIEPKQPSESIEHAGPQGEGRSVDVASQQLAGYFSINNPSGTDAEQIAEIGRILGFSMENPAQLLWQMRNLESRIGAPQLGMSRLQHVYNYIKLDSQIRDLENLRASYGP